jgi:hypothetical protein
MAPAICSGCGNEVDTSKQHVVVDNEFFHTACTPSGGDDAATPAEAPVAVEEASQEFPTDEVAPENSTPTESPSGTP